MYAFSVKELPEIKKVYSIVRHSIWQAIDPNHIIIYIKDGRCFFEINNIKYDATTGDCIFIPKNTIYTRYPFKKTLCTMVYIHFNSHGVAVTEEDLKSEINNLKNHIIKQEFINTLKFNNFYIHTHTRFQDKKDIIEDLLNHAFSLNPKYQFYYNIPFSSFLVQLMAMMTEKSITELNEKIENDSSAKIPEQLRRAIYYIQQNYYKHIKLEDLSEFCFTSKIQLNRLFNAYLNTTPVNYIIKYKLNKARDLLQNYPDMSIKEISCSIGYEDQCYFSRLFAKFFGESPTDFR